jgi:hypothetical protein
MNLPNSFNATADFVLARLWLVKVVAVAVVVLGAALWLHHHDTDIRTSERAIVAMQHNQARESAAVETLKVVTLQVVHDSVRVVRTLHRVDSLWQAVPETLATRADTIQALQQLPVLRLATDSAIHACSETQSLFYRYRTACDSQAASLRDERDGWKQRFENEHPSKVKKALLWTAAIGSTIGAAYIGFRVGKAVVR